MSVQHTHITNRNPLTELIDVERHVGFMLSINFEEAVLLSNDYWKEIVGGIPMNSFLLASSFYKGNYEQTPNIDREVILLRVLGPSELPIDRTRLDAMIDSYSKRTQLERAKKPVGMETYDFDVLDGFDPFTHTELQFGALRCRIVGSFYIKEGILNLGSDVENFASASHLRAYKPTSEALRTIVNFVDPIRKKQADTKAKELGFTQSPKNFNLGSVRYTSTDRMHRSGKEALVPVGVNPLDFLGRRTAVFGMTRTGKSNMVKTMVSAVSLAGMKDNVTIGQCIFDINGEYANANNQDAGSSIADVFGEKVICYRGTKPPRTGFKDLRNNFYQEPQVGLKIIQELLQEGKGLANDMSILANSISLDEPPAEAGESDKSRWMRRIAAFKALLYKNGFETTGKEKVRFGVDKQILRQILQKIYPDVLNEAIERSSKEKWTQEEIKNFAFNHFPKYSEGVSLRDAARFFEDARQADRIIQKEYDPQGKQVGFWKSLQKSGTADPWFDDELSTLANLIGSKNALGNYIKVASYLKPVAEHHSIASSSEVESDIYKLLANGFIVIIDLSVGHSKVRESISERIARNIFSQSMGIFHNGKTPPNIVVYVEEAHNLIGRNAEPDETWPRIAKEGAKAHLSLVYATQEPSSIQPNIMANTENWIVTHLNNDDELRVLGKFYDFSDFIQSLKRAQDVGFARVKTLSSPYVVPTQIDLFEPKKIKAKIAEINIASSSSVAEEQSNFQPDIWG
ncbi:MAG: DUF87 domain-containing protein [Thiolinea sp.]